MRRGVVLAVVRCGRLLAGAAALAALLSLPGHAQGNGAAGWDFSAGFVQPSTNRNQALSILTREEVAREICPAHRGSVPLMLGHLRLRVRCDLFLYARTHDRLAAPTPADAPFGAGQLAMRLDRAFAAVLIWQPPAGPVPFAGEHVREAGTAPVGPCRPLISAYEKCVSGEGLASGSEWDFVIRREPLETDGTLNPYNENFLKCRAVAADLHCEFFDNTAHIVEVRVRFRAGGDITDAALIGLFRNFQQQARIQTHLRLEVFEEK